MQWRRLPIPPAYPAWRRSAKAAHDAEGWDAAQARPVAAGGPAVPPVDDTAVEG